VRLRYVVEGEHAVAELGEEVGAEGHYGPERELRPVSEADGGMEAGERTTGMTSFWSFSGRGARPRKATMYI